MSSSRQPAEARLATSAGRLSRRELLARTGILAGAVPLVGAVDGLFVTPGWLTATSHTVGGGGRPEQATLRVLQVSDLHLRTIGGLEQRLLAALHAAAPDVIAFTGDVVDRQTALPQLEIFLRECPRQPRCYAITGNWEHWSGVPLGALEKLYERHGVELLVNRSVEFAQDGCRVRVTGLDDLIGGSPDAAAALRDAAPCPNHVVLAHCPAVRDAVPLPAEHPADFMLSGHTHGGQIAPLGIVLKLPHGSGGYVSGWYRDDGPALYVSRGIGTSLVPMRIGATPELAQFDWSLG